MGLGLYEEGSGIAATKFLLSQGAKVTVTDLKSKEQLKDQLLELEKYKKNLDSRLRGNDKGGRGNDKGRRGDDIKYVLGQHRDQDFVSADLIVKNPGVPAKSKYLALARKNNIPVVTDISLFFQLVDRKRLIGITGTRGKSTTTSLIYDLIKSQDRQAVLGGNILKSPLAQMAQVKKGGSIILELSSWMLESLIDIKTSPHIAVFTNIYPDHLNTYDSIEDYFTAKKNIYRFQSPQDYIVLNRDNKYTVKAGKEVVAQRYWFSLKPFAEENGCYVKNNSIWFRQNGVEQKMCSLADIRLPGEHNLSNILAAVCVAGICGIKPPAVGKVVRSFKGVPNRLELLREIRGVKYYNDTTSTTPEATIAALRALGQKNKKTKKQKNKNIILIAGGADKGLDFKILTKEIKQACKAVVLLNGTGTQRLNYELSASASPQRDGRITNYDNDLVIANSMADAVGLAKSFAKKGDIILLSPACASFGMFNNEFDRGDQFRKLVNKLK